MPLGSLELDVREAPGPSKIIPVYEPVLGLGGVLRPAGDAGVDAYFRPVRAAMATRRRSILRDRRQ